MNTIRHSYFVLPFLAGVLAVAPAYAWNMGPSMGGGAASNAAAAAAGAAANAASNAASNAANAAMYGAVSSAGGSAGASAGAGDDSGASAPPTVPDATSALQAALLGGGATPLGAPIITPIVPIGDPGDAPGPGSNMFASAGGSSSGTGYVQGSGILAALLDPSTPSNPTPAQMQQAQDEYNAALAELQRLQNIAQMVWASRYNGPGDWSPLDAATENMVRGQAQDGIPAQGIPGLPPGADENEQWRHWVYTVGPAMITNAVNELDSASADLTALQNQMGAY